MRYLKGGILQRQRKLVNEQLEFEGNFICCRLNGRLGWI